MTSYGHGYYTYMKRQKIRAGTRAIKNVALDLNYAQKQHFEYLGYKRNMKRWRKNMKNVKILKERLKGEMF